MAYTGNDPYEKAVYEMLRNAGFEEADIEMLLYERGGRVRSCSEWELLRRKGLVSWLKSKL